MSKPKTVRLYPVPGVSVYPYPSEECEVDEATAAELLAYIPAPFTVEPPVGEPGPETVVVSGSVEQATSPSETAATASED